MFKLPSDASLYIYLPANASCETSSHPFKSVNVISQLDFILLRYKFKSIRFLAKLTASDLILNEPGRERETDLQTDRPVFFPLQLGRKGVH